MISTHLQKLAECKANFQRMDKNDPQEFVKMHQTFQPTYLVAAKIFNMMFRVHDAVIDESFNALNIQLPPSQALLTEVDKVAMLIVKTRELADEIEVVAEKLRAENGGTLIPLFIKYNSEN